MWTIKLFLGHFQRLFEEQTGLGILFLHFSKDSIGEIDNPIDRMIIRHAWEYLGGLSQLLLGFTDLVDHYQIFRIVTIANRIEDVVVTHLFFA